MVQIGLEQFSSHVTDVTAAAFGKERVGMVFGWIFAAHQLGSATAAYGAGLVRVHLLSL
jgi:hypothetical protein